MGTRRTSVTVLASHRARSTAVYCNEHGARNRHRQHSVFSSNAKHCCRLPCHAMLHEYSLKQQTGGTLTPAVLPAGPGPCLPACPPPTYHLWFIPSADLSAVESLDLGGGLLLHRLGLRRRLGLHRGLLGRLEAPRVARPLSLERFVQGLQRRPHLSVGVSVGVSVSVSVGGSHQAIRVAMALTAAMKFMQQQTNMQKTLKKNSRNESCSLVFHLVQIVLGLVSSISMHT